MKQIGRRSLLAGVVGASGMALAEPDQESRKAPKKLADPAALDRAAAAPVLKLDGLKSPVIIDSMKLLKKGNDYLVHVRSKDGAEGVSITNPPRAQYLDHVFKQLVAPFFIGKDARDLDSLLRGLYRWKSNYKMYGLGFWSAQAWAEFAILDMLGQGGRQADGRPAGRHCAARTCRTTWPADGATPRRNRRSTTCKSWSPTRAPRR